MSDELNAANEYLIVADKGAKEIITENDLLTTIADDTVLAQVVDESTDVNNTELSKDREFEISSNDVQSVEEKSNHSPQPLTPTTMALVVEVPDTATTEPSIVSNVLASDLPDNTTTEDEQINNILKQAGVVSEDAMTVVTSAEANVVQSNEESPFEFISTDPYGNSLVTVSEYSFRP